jgi:hypothetical protein
MTWKKRRCPFCEKSYNRLYSLIDHCVVRHGKNITWVNTWNEKKKILKREIHYPKSHEGKKQN